MALVTLCKESEVPEGRGKSVLVDGVDVALFKVNGNIFALENSCPHKGGPLAEGEITNGCCITCPLHNWEFDLKTGKSTGDDLLAKTFPVKIDNGEVKVEF